MWSRGLLDTIDALPSPKKSKRKRDRKRLSVGA
jgi:hypothetical protein